MHRRRDRSGVLVPPGHEEEGPQSFTDPSRLGLGRTSNRLGPNGRTEQGGKATDGQLRRKLNDVAPVVQDLEEGNFIGGQVMTDPPRPSSSVHQAWRETIHLIGNGERGRGADLGGEPKEAGGVETCGPNPRCLPIHSFENSPWTRMGHTERSLHSPPVEPSAYPDQLIVMLKS
jgi:hypothetical protein